MLFGGCGGVGDSSRLGVACTSACFGPVNKTSFSQLTTTLQDPFEEAIGR